MTPYTLAQEAKPKRQFGKAAACLVGGLVSGYIMYKLGPDPIIHIFNHPPGDVALSTKFVAGSSIASAFALLLSGCAAISYLSPVRGEHEPPRNKRRPNPEIR